MPSDASDQDAFNRSILALVHALVTIVVERGLATERQVERLVARATADIDQWSAEDRDEARPPSPRRTD